jgi:threonine dehydratase
MMIEIDAQLNGKPPDLIVTPVGVGSFAQAVVTYSKKADRGTRVLSVEADTAACLWKSLHTGHSVQVKTRSTIMSGMNCGTISTNAWPILKSGVDMSVAVSDAEADEAVEDLSEVGLNSGPCGASTLAALRLVSTTYFASLGLTKDSIVLLPCTEGPREYKRTRSPDDSPISC